MAAGGSKKVIVISLIANFSIALAKLFGSFYTSSSALMSEAIHSFSDCCNQILLLYGGYAAKKGISEKYPLGQDKEIFFWSFIVAFLLFSMGGVFSIKEGIHKILHPHPLSHPHVGVIILVIGILLEGYSFYACFLEVKQEKKKKSLWHWIKKTHSADLLVIFLEDFAALAGLVLALVALGLSWYTGDAIWDGIGSVVIGIFLVITAWILAVELRPMLIGERASKEYQDQLESVLEEYLPGAKFLNFISLQQGIKAVMLAYKVKPQQVNADTIKQLNNFEEKVKELFPEVKWQFAEIDNKD